MAAEAETVRVEVAIGWDVGAERVRTETCPAATEDGWKLAVTPLGTPVTASVARALKPLVLFTVTASAVDWPWIRVPVPGVTLTEKLDDVVTVKAVAELTL